MEMRPTHPSWNCWNKSQFVEDFVYISAAASRDERKNWARAIAMMRQGFGGHVYGADAATRQERREGRVGDIYRGDE